jgi:hypothetical protein
MSMHLLRRIGQWVTWGSFGPVVFLIGAVGLYYTVRLNQSDRDDYQSPLMVMATSLDGLAAIAGALLILRPKTNHWWVLGITLSMCVANLGASLHAYGPTAWGIQDAAFWVIEAGLLTFYAYHCHVPGYRWGAPLIWHSPDRDPVGSPFEGSADSAT